MFRHPSSDTTNVSRVLLRALVLCTVLAFLLAPGLGPVQDVAFGPHADPDGSPAMLAFGPHADPDGSPVMLALGPHADPDGVRLQSA